MISNKKINELLLAEKYLDFYNQRNKTFYRIDYCRALSENESQYPDLECFDLRNPQERFGIEVTKAPDLQQNERSDGVQEKLWAGIVKIINSSEIEGTPIKADTSFAISYKDLTSKNIAHDLELLTKEFQGLYLESYLRETTDLTVRGYLCLREITIQSDKPTGVGFGWSKEIQLDPLEKAISAYNNKQEHSAGNTSLVIYMDEPINEYYRKEIIDYFEGLDFKFKEIAIIEKIKFGTITVIFKD